MPGMVVLGMHRSGTSAVTRILNLLGADVGPEDDLLTEYDNPSGHWESKALVACNDRILAAFGRSWDFPPWLGPDWELLAARPTPAARPGRHLRRRVPLRTLGVEGPPDVPDLSLVAPGPGPVGRGPGAAGPGRGGVVGEAARRDPHRVRHRVCGTATSAPRCDPPTDSRSCACTSTTSWRRPTTTIGRVVADLAALGVDLGGDVSTAAASLQGQLVHDEEPTALVRRLTERTVEVLRVDSPGQRVVPAAHVVRAALGPPRPLRLPGPVGPAGPARASIDPRPQRHPGPGRPVTGPPRFRAPSVGRGLRGVLVLGMHRSGTSAATRLVNALGSGRCALPGTWCGARGTRAGTARAARSCTSTTTSCAQMGRTWWYPPPAGDAYGAVAARVTTTARPGPPGLPACAPRRCRGCGRTPAPRCWCRSGAQHSGPVWRRWSCSATRSRWPCRSQRRHGVPTSLRGGPVGALQPTGPGPLRGPARPRDPLRRPRGRPGALVGRAPGSSWPALGMRLRATRRRDAVGRDFVDPGLRHSTHTRDRRGRGVRRRRLGALRHARGRRRARSASFVSPGLGPEPDAVAAELDTVGPGAELAWHPPSWAVRSDGAPSPGPRVRAVAGIIVGDEATATGTRARPGCGVAGERPRGTPPMDLIERPGNVVRRHPWEVARARFFLRLVERARA